MESLSQSKKMSIEKGLAQSKDSLQIMYLRDYEYIITEVLVIENNTTLAIELQKNLRKLGFQEIYLSETGTEGIKIFSDLADMGKVIPVIIDDKISDKDVKDVVKEILQIHPGAKIIVESSNEPTDLQIKELFDMGVVSHINKPLKFDNIKKSVTEAVKDTVTEGAKETVTEGAKETVTEGAKENTTTESLEERVDKELKQLLKPYKKISKKKILNSLSFKQSEIEQSLERLEFAQKVIPLDEIKQIVCNECDSDNVVQIASCPDCDGVNIFHRILIECLKCKHTFEQKFEGMDSCPECRNTLNVKGMDYAKLENNYYCTECMKSQSELKYILECWSCQNKFERKDAKWENTACYKIKS